MSKIKDIYIDNKISATLSEPFLNYKRRVPFVLFFHGFGTDKNEVGNIFLLIAEKLLSLGIGSLRIDFSGFGESKGSIEETTVNHLMQDAELALNYLFQLPYVDPNQIGICGFSLGAAISILMLNSHKIKSLALLSPAGDLCNDFKSYFGEKIYQELENSKMPLEIDLGWRKVVLKNTFIKSLENIPLIDYLKMHQGDFLIVSGKNDFCYKHANGYFAQSQSIKKVFHTAGDSDHIFNAFDPKTSQVTEISDRVANWFDNTLSSKM